jgi:adenylosuccinate synthase
LQARKREELRAELASLQGSEAANAERWILEDPEIVDRFLDALAPLQESMAIVDDGWLQAALAGPGAVVLEGAQGVLLDEWAGFHPHTTWSTCTFQRALELLRDGAYGGATTRIGVLRAYAVRHGDGPFPTEDRRIDPMLPERHNENGRWQGPVRRGWPDLLLARYALEVCGGADGLAITHLDALGKVPAWRACTGYSVKGASKWLFDTPPGTPDHVTRIRPPTGHDLDRQAALGAALSTATPVYESVPWTGEGAEETAARFFEERLGVPVRLAASGPTANHVTDRPAARPPA